MNEDRLEALVSLTLAIRNRDEIRANFDDSPRIGVAARVIQLCDILDELNEIADFDTDMRNLRESQDEEEE